MDKFECDDFVEEVTNYLDGSLNADVLARIADHLQLCWPCVYYVGEIEVAAQLTAGLPAEGMSAGLEKALLASYREWAASAVR